MQVRDIKRIRVYSPTTENRRRFADDMARQFGVEVEALDDPREVYRGADILAACTDSAVPVIRGEWLEAGMHVISVGGRPDPAARARFDLTLRLGTAPAPVGRVELGTADEYIGYMARPNDPAWATQRMGKPAPIVTGRGDDVMLADIIEGRTTGTTGRTSDAQITYSERGNIQGAQFHAVAAVAYEAAVKQGIGHELPSAWFLQDIRD
jgi:hypothetical protein